MFNASSLLARDQPMMRPIIKQSASSARMDPLTYGTRALSSSCYSTTTVVAINKKTAFELHNIHCTNFLCPFAYIINTNTIMAHTRNCFSAIEATATRLHHYLEVNKNAVLLHDIEPQWHALEADSAILLASNNYPRKIYDDDLNLSAIHNEAQKYNEINESQQTLDTFWMESVLQHVVLYLRNSWFELTSSQRCTLSTIVKENYLGFTVFDQLSWLGYDCLIRSYNYLIKIIEYNRILNNITGAPNKNVEHLAVAFGINFTFSKDVIDACDEHFAKCSRQRMRYTKMFNKN